MHMLSSHVNYSVAESFPLKSRWCSTERACRGITFVTVLGSSRGFMQNRIKTYRITEFLAIDNGGYMYTNIILFGCHSVAEYFLGRCANEYNIVHFELS